MTSRRAPAGVFPDHPVHPGLLGGWGLSKPPVPAIAGASFRRTEVRRSSARASVSSGLGAFRTDRASRDPELPAGLTRKISPPAARSAQTAVVESAALMEGCWSPRRARFLSLARTR